MSRIPGPLPQIRLVLALILIALPLAAQPAHVIISQVYGGGGNSGAYWKQDFIELYNPTSSAVVLDGWSVQYASSTGSSWSNRTNLSGMIQPGRYFLIREAQGSGGTADLPTPDVTGSIAMSGTAGKVALVSDTTALSGTCPTGGAIVDFVGYGSATNCSETAPTANLSNTTSASRISICADTDNNSADFSVGAVDPHNSASPSLSITNPSTLPTAIRDTPYSITFTPRGGSCGGYIFSQIAGTIPPGLTLTGDTLSGAPNTTAGSPFSFTIQVTDNASTAATKDFSLAVIFTCPATHSISQIQGSGTASPLVGSTVTAGGLVTALKYNGFFMQAPAAEQDADPNTSEGVFVYTGGAPTAAVGDSVCVTGTVSEYYSFTEIGGSPGVITLSSGNPLPDPVVLTTSDLTPSGGLSQLEKYEAMRVQVNDLTVAGPTLGTINEPNATSTTKGQFFGVIAGTPKPFREPGIELPTVVPGVPSFDGNPEILQVDSIAQPGSTALEVGAGANVSGLAGPLEYTYGRYTIDLDPTPAPVVTGNPSASAVPAATDSQVSVASLNLQRFYDTTDDAGVSDAVLTPTAFANRLNKASLAIRNILNTPDILAVVEMENLSTLQALAAKINADAAAAGAPDPQYAAYLEEGNDIGGIDVGFLVKPARVNVLSVTQYGKDATYTRPDGSTGTTHDRPPLALRANVFRAGSDQPLPVIVIANHLMSLTNVDDPSDGARVRAKRKAQAEFLAALVQTLQTDYPGESVVLTGDFNSYQFSDGYVDTMGAIMGYPTPADQVVLAAGSDSVPDPKLTNLGVALLSPSEIYSYSYNGSAQALDHIVVNDHALAAAASMAFAHPNSIFPNSYRNDPNRPERVSDHDAPVAYFNLPFNRRPAAAAQTEAVSYGVANTFTLDVSDADGDALVFITTALPAKGTVIYDNATRQATYTPNENTTGSDVFTYQATDPGGLTATATVTVNISPRDLTGSVQVSKSGFVYSWVTQTYVGTITVKNTGTVAIMRPIQVALTNLTAGVTALNPVGTVAGAPYYTLTGTENLAPDASASIRVQFSNPSGGRIDFDPVAYSGVF